VWSAIGRQLAHPTGLGGLAMGRALAIANRQPVRLAIDALAVAPGEVILELGFGPGRAIAKLATLVASGRVLGIDHSSTMLAQASRYNRRVIAIGRVRLEQGRFDHLPWPAGSVDKILAANVVYFFRDNGAEMREANRVLRPGGTMAIYATDRSSMAAWKFAQKETHHAFDHDDLITLIRLGGFSDHDMTIMHPRMGFGIAGLLAVVRKPSK
jgi:ubiquinone/menaquinone biosynthesis C-methylase UbiE